MSDLFHRHRHRSADLSPADAAAYLTSRIRRGEVTHQQVELAASLGHPS